MLEILTAQNVPVKLCKTCTDGRGITGLPLIDGVEIGTLVELAEWTLDADKVLTFNNKPVKILFSYGRGFSIKFTCGVADRHGNNTAGISLCSDRFVLASLPRRQAAGRRPSSQYRH